MNNKLFSHIIKAIILCFSLYVLPIFELKGVYFFIGLIIIGFIFFELSLIFKNLFIVRKKLKTLFKYGYEISFLFTLLLSCFLLPQINTSSGFRFLRVLIIVLFVYYTGNFLFKIFKSTPNNLLKNSLLVIFSSITILSFLEILFMYVSMTHGSGNAYSGKIWGERYWKPINQFGFRDTEPKKSKNTIFFVGDSFTAGWGVKKIENRFDKQAVSNLIHLGKTVNGINIGRFGADTKLEFHLMKRFIEQSSIKPDKIVLQYFVNDVDKFLISNSKCVVKTEPPSKLIMFFKQGSYLINFIDALYPSQSNVVLPRYCDYSEMLKNFYTTDSLWKMQEYQLDRFKNYCVNNNIELTLLFFPFMEDLELSKQLNIDKRLNKYCSKNNLQFINVSEIIGGLSQRDRRASITDAHASDKVHLLVGKKLAYLLN